MPRCAALLALTCLAVSASAQPPQIPPTPRPFRVQAKVVQVPVLVTDKARTAPAANRSGTRDGFAKRGSIVPANTAEETRTIDGLSARDFSVLDNGVPQDITLDDFAGGLPPISLVVAVQCSRTSELALADIRRIGAMIQPLITGQRGEVAVVAFDREIRWMQDFTRSDGKIHDAIASLGVGANTGARIFDTLAEAAARMSPRQGRKVVLLISQSNDSGSHIKLNDAIQIVEREGIQVFAAHYSSYKMSWISRSEDFPDKPTLDQMFFTELARLGSVNHVKALAFATGGADYNFARQQGLDKAMEQLGGEVHSQYILSFPQHDDAPGVHVISVSIPARADLSIRSRQAYWVGPQ